MICRAFSFDGVFPVTRRRSKRGFTLIEICTVLFILVLLLAVVLPNIESAMVEQAVRSDAHQLALMVKTAMLQSSDQHRPYVIELNPEQLTLHPLDVTATSENGVDPPLDGAETNATPPPENVEMTCHLSTPNRLLVPDPQRANVWMTIPPTEWAFRAGELCPASRVRLSRGKSWMEISFNALTGNVEDEASYFP